MVISISPARMGKLVARNAFELGFAVWKFVTFKRKKGRATFPDPAATFRDSKATLRDQRVLYIISHWGRTMLQLKPIQGQIQTCLCQSKLLQLQQAGV